MNPRCTHGRNGAVEVIDLHHEPVPSTGLWSGSVRHRLRTSALAPRGAEDQPEVAALEHREGRSRVRLLAETEVLAVERDRLVDVLDDVTNTDRRHAGSPLAPHVRRRD